MSETLTVRAPSPQDWLDAAALDTATAPPAYTLTPIDRALRLPLELLTPGRPYTLRLRVEGQPAAGATRLTLVLDGVARYLPAGPPVWLEWSTAAARPLVLDVLAVGSLTVHELTLTAPGREGRRAPGDELSLELLLPRAEGETFTLDASRLDRAALTKSTPWPGTFVLGSSRLNESYLYLADLIEWWSPVLGLASSVATHRAARTDGAAPVAETGTLAARFPNALDPRQVGARAGTPVRLYHWPSRRALFTGAISRAAVEPHRPGRRLRFVTVIEAADAVSTLAGTTRYGALVGVGLGESWRDRVARLMASAPELSWSIAPAATEYAPTMANNVHEASLAAHLDIAAASARGCWWLDAGGIVRLCPGRPAGAPVALFTDTPAPDVEAWAYVSAAAGWDSAAVASVVELVNLGAAYDAEQGAWGADDATLTVTNATLAATYGRRRLAGTINVAAGEGEAIAAALARGLSSAARVTRVSLDGAASMQRAAELELFTLARARLRGDERTALITGIAHTIDPRGWRVDVDLNREDEN